MAIEDEKESRLLGDYVSKLRSSWWLHLFAGILVAGFCYFSYGRIGGLSFGVLYKVAHLAASSIHLGAQVWVSFIAGVTMVKNLPRHEFGAVQSKLFPKYFTLGIITKVVAILTFYMDADQKHDRHGIQMCLMSVALVCDIMNRVVFVPWTLTTMDTVYKHEKECGVGNQVGYKSTPELDANEAYQKAKGTFQWVHGGSAIANLASFLCSIGHMSFLALKL